jgi:hypothetical protein
MGLQIERKPGEDFYVRDERFEVAEIHDLISCTIMRTSDGEKFKLKHMTMTDIAQDVKATVGERGQFGLTRVNFEADRSIPIVRGELYRPNPISN